MNPIHKVLRQSPVYMIPSILYLGLVIILGLFGCQAYVLLINHTVGGVSLPPNFGNHPHVIKMLTDQRKNVFGDDFHGYARIRLGYPTYLVSGGAAVISKEMVNFTMI